MRLEQGQTDHQYNSNDPDVNQAQNPKLQREAERTRQRTEDIKKIITDLDTEYSNQHSGSHDPAYSEFRLPGAVALLSDPEREHALPFPIVYSGTPTRFEVSEDYWRYVGREIFPTLLRSLRLVQKNPSYKRLWVYGTRGYGKSHLLAALVCYMSALGEHVIYVPDCRSWLDDPAGVFKAALMFAFPDKTTQDKILTLDTRMKLQNFVHAQENVLFVIGQMNAISSKTEDTETLRLRKLNLSDWLIELIPPHKAVLSSSANNRDYLMTQNKENYNYTMNAYGGLTQVYLNTG